MLYCYNRTAWLRTSTSSGRRGNSSLRCPVKFPQTKDILSWFCTNTNATQHGAATCNDHELHIVITTPRAVSSRKCALSSANPRDRIKYALTKSRNTHTACSPARDIDLVSSRPALHTWMHTPVQYIDNIFYEFTAAIVHCALAFEIQFLPQQKLDASS